MSPPGMTRNARSVRFPRVSGDEPRVYRNILMLREFSPRERG